MKSLAAVLEKLNEPLKIIELDIPPLKPGQVLVKIAYSGLCHSQLNEIKGKRGEDKFLPHTMGHEASGTVLQVGEGVTKVKVGDHVVASWIKGNGLNVAASQYLYGKEVVNSGAISTFMTHAVISENRLIPIEKDLSLKLAALLGCALPTGIGMVLNTAKVKPGSSIAIFGLGGIGMSALIGAKLMYASNSIAIDISEEKLNLAKQLGATHTINASKENVNEKILEYTCNLGVDYSIEAAGNKSAMQQAFKSVKNHTGLCVIAGNLKHDQTIEINPFDLILGKKIIGTWGGESKIDEDIFLYSKLLKEAKINLDPLISHEFKLDQINEAVSLLDEGKAVRCLINLGN
ncbi:MAG: S-(hydroxymethyl)glutathione dehydrogenase [Chlamydiae bacterium]|nr:S-(hydroxymethyl)glutathione dehydrogenase [Chlamydiota bacterium]